MKIDRTAFKNAAFTALYIIVVASFMNYGSQIKLGRVNTVLAPIALLMLLVTSASITGYLIFGKPVQLYIDTKKKEAISLLTHTLIYFSAITFVAIVLLLIFTR